MKFGSPDRRRRRLPGLALGLAAVALALYSGCGQMPPAEKWAPTPADSAAIAAAVDANAAILTLTFNEPAMLYNDTVLSDTNKKRLNREITDNPYKPRFRCDSFQHIFYPESLGHDFITTFVATLDTFRDSVLHGSVQVETTWIETTATVMATETIPGKLLLHAYQSTRYLRDTFFVTGPGETLWLPLYARTFTDTSLWVEKPIASYASGGCVLRKEQGQWVLWKLGGGQRYYAPNPDDAPYLAAVYLNSGGRIDTVSLRPDTLHYGVQRFYGAQEGNSQLLTFSKGDSIWVSALLTSMTDAANYLHFKGQRYKLALSSKIKLDTEGTSRLYVEQVPIPVLYEEQGKYVATLWGIPIRVIP